MDCNTPNLTPTTHQVPEHTPPQRVDRFLSFALGISRNQIEAAIRAELVEIGGVVVKKGGVVVHAGEQVVVHPRKTEPSEGQKIAHEVSILYEDAHLMVLSKPPFLVVHDAPSVREPTLVDWLRRQGVRLSTLSGEERHGIVHRLDKETSGALVVAKENAIHTSLQQQLEKRQMGRFYLALIDRPLKEDLIVERPLGRHPTHRLKHTVLEGGRGAKTSFFKWCESQNGTEELLLCQLHTGRTHQIRAHLASLGRHILGDTLYGFKSAKATIPRVLLHAHLLYLTHPISGRPMLFHAPLHPHLKEHLDAYFPELAGPLCEPHAVVARFGLDERWLLPPTWQRNG